MTHDVQQRAFDEDGFVAIRQFCQGDDLAALIANVERYVREVVPGLPREHVFYEDKNDPTSLKQLQCMADHDSWFHEMFVAGPCRALAERLLRGPVIPKNMQYFNKPSGLGKPTPPHQDGYYFMLDPCEALTMWLALDEVDEENGCVRYVRGSHKAGLRTHGRTQTLGFSQGIVDYPTEEDTTSEIAVPASPGDLLVHHAKIIHRADRNRSKTRSRRALGLVFFSERAKEDKVAQKAYQQKLANELSQAGRI